jgi:hypothetical protein
MRADEAAQKQGDEAAPQQALEVRMAVGQPWASAAEAAPQTREPEGAAPGGRAQAVRPSLAGPPEQT